MKLEAHNLNAFYGRAQILFDVGLKAGAGEVVALIGRNGAGKSTTFKSLVGLVPQRTGQLVFNGTDISALPVHDIVRLGLGYVPEDRRIFTDLTVEENLDVGTQPPRDGAPTWTKERLFHLFPNLAGMRDRGAGRMSGGEQQMLTIARSLMGNPSLIMLDEPSEGLAPKIVEDMANAILAMKNEGLAVLISEQNLHFAKMISDRAYIIEKGRICFDGTMAELSADEEVRNTYLAV
ncbi:ABC transporter ATP-binding protein [Paramagnetospirillum magneticum]|uniref:ABC-type branched-chain amino acid transport systems n=1 Tax=Paramagnetospirillum magneticum (strain ATCC 700264 / AMB-1) TaxID=342108 RepID=Q2W796_PARM1|nr:ABC transporter ATP-binding protein [Paramagnetospirillum magneticum]BAE50279.1 ABC-type branched-chain amino acid transport systems [Paramagnetospirillum magneticum AMB-1]